MPGPDFVHLERLLAAEHARMRGQVTRAVALYREATQRALRQRHVQHAALAQERLSEMLREQRRFTDAGSALREAIEHYATWGASGKIARLRDRQEELM